MMESISFSLDSVCLHFPASSRCLSENRVSAKLIIAEFPLIQEEGWWKGVDPRCDVPPPLPGSPPLTPATYNSLIQTPSAVSGAQKAWSPTGSLLKEGSVRPGRVRVYSPSMKELSQVSLVAVRGRFEVKSQVWMVKASVHPHLILLSLF